MKRKAMSKAHSRKVFRKTAGHHKLNTTGHIKFRGGIRL